MWTSSDQFSIQTQHYHQLVKGGCPAHNFQSWMKIMFSHWETVYKCTFPKCLIAQLLAAECSDFALIQDELHPCASPVGTVSVFHEGGDSAQSTIKGHWNLWWSICTVPRGNDSERLTLWEGPSSGKKTHPGRTEMPKHERGIPRHLWGSKQICSFVNLTLLTGWGTDECLKVPEALDNFKCQGHELSFNHETTSLMLDLTRSGLLALFVTTTPLLIRVGEPYVGFIHG